MHRRIIKKIKVKYTENKLNVYIRGKYIFSSEMMILAGLLDEYPKESINCYNHNNIIRYGNLKDLCKEKINLVDSPEISDILILPYKFQGTEDPVFNYLETLSKKHNKKLLCFYNDDDDKKFDIGKNTILYRTSFYKSSKLDNEKPLIAIATDFYKNIILEAKLSIGYCGHSSHGREKYIKILQESKLDTNFIIRKGFWAPGVDKKIAIKQYFENIENNLFIFCYRGGGNFSYRFYETLMMGRIPIVINTDCVFTFEEKVKNCGLFIEEKDITDDNYLIEQIEQYYEINRENIKQIQLNNRKFWEDYYSPIGFTNNLILEFSKINNNSEYTLNRGLKEWKLNKEIFEEKIKEKFNISSNEIKFYSQQDEDKYIIQKILKEKINDGVFLELGACDGLLYSNTKTLEDYFGFTGILIEPQKHFFDKLIINRNKCKNYNNAISDSDEEFIIFTGNNAEGGISETINTNKFAGNYKVRNNKLKDIIIKSNFNYIDIMIIDVEGGELEVLKSIDFSFPIFCIFVEAHSDQQEKNKIFGDHLKSNGFSYIERQRGNEVWINHNYFRKDLFNIPTSD